MKIVMTRTAKVGGVYVVPGATVEVSEKRADQLRRQGKTGPIKSGAAGKAAGKAAKAGSSQ